MKPNTRSAGGAVLMLVIIPVIVGLLACMPVPVGDPERSRIDPQISGVWVLLDNRENPGFFAFEPYDKRTWLLTAVPIEENDDTDFAGMPIEEGDDVDFVDLESKSYSDFAEFIDKEPVVGQDGLTAGKIENYKVWRTKLGGQWFMTWEPKMVFAAEDFEPEAWFVFRLDLPDENTLELTMLDDDLFKDVEETRRAYERVIKKNVRNEDLYDEGPIRFHRVKPEHLDFFEDLAREVINN